MPQFRIYGYPPKWQLASIDPECLTVLYYCQLYQISYNYIPCEASFSPTGVLPMLRHDPMDSGYEQYITVTGSWEIMKYLCKYIKDSQFNDTRMITPYQTAVQTIYQSLIERDIIQGMICYLFMDDDYFHNVITRYGLFQLDRYPNWYRFIPANRMRSKLCEDYKNITIDELVERFQSALLSIDARYQKDQITPFLYSNEIIQLVSYLIWLRRLPVNTNATLQVILARISNISELVITAEKSFNRIFSIDAYEIPSSPSLKQIFLDILYKYREWTLDNRNRLDSENVIPDTLSCNNRWIVAGTAAFALFYLFHQGIIRIEMEQYS